MVSKERICPSKLLQWVNGLGEKMLASSLGTKPERQRLTLRLPIHHWPLPGRMGTAAQDVGRCVPVVVRPFSSLTTKHSNCSPKVSLLIPGSTKSE